MAASCGTKCWVGLHDAFPSYRLQTHRTKLKPNTHCRRDSTGPGSREGTYQRVPRSLANCNRAKRGDLQHLCTMDMTSKILKVLLSLMTRPANLAYDRPTRRLNHNTGKPGALYSYQHCELFTPRRLLQSLPARDRLSPFDNSPPAECLYSGEERMLQSSNVRQHRQQVTCETWWEHQQLLNLEY